jgi:hypothetical protein
MPDHGRRLARGIRLPASERSRFEPIWQSQNDKWDVATRKLQCRRWTHDGAIGATDTAASGGDEAQHCGQWGASVSRIMWQELCCAWMVTAANVEKATKLILAAIVYGLWIGAVIDALSYYYVL